VEDLREKREVEQRNKLNRRKNRVSYLKKQKKTIAYITIATIILLFPTQSGEIIGQFITDFFGTILKFINF